jgi:hypothetical protein
MLRSEHQGSLDYVLCGERLLDSAADRMQEEVGEGLVYGLESLLFKGTLRYPLDYGAFTLVFIAVASGGKAEEVALAGISDDYKVGGEPIVLGLHVESSVDGVREVSVRDAQAENDLAREIARAVTLDEVLVRFRKGDIEALLSYPYFLIGHPAHKICKIGVGIDDLGSFCNRSH